ncbi:hypothetical protein SAMN02799624_05268 [Paenibacillus sp. UNC496MF]|nr:hypothetical protein SAMN02799624_05268 [Paenibacillus sp. UNC496MF]
MNRIGPIMDRIIDSTLLLVLSLVILTVASFALSIYALILFIALIVLFACYVRWSVQTEPVEEDHQHDDGHNNMQPLSHRRHA